MHIMLDLETLDTANTAVVLSIGAVAFDPDEGETDKANHFYVEMSHDIMEQQRLGRTISGDTVVWWMQQSYQARRLFEPVLTQQHKPTYLALEAFRQFLDRFPHAPLWGNGADFDNAILSSLYKAYGLSQPWSHKQNRCFRTMKAVCNQCPPPERFGTHHNALDDALTQARHLQEIYACLPTQ